MNTEQTTSRIPHISVCICTFKRPSLLKRLLEGLSAQDTSGLFSFSIVVVDNDQSESARPVAENFMARSPLQAAYYVEPRQNIALARNMAIEHATGDFVALIDDDEFPAREWLWNLFSVCTSYDVAGVLGPVRPHFTYSPPAWMIKGRFAERQTYSTGHVLDWRQSKTGNVLLKKQMLRGHKTVFRSQFGTGGEDVDFFERMIKEGWVFVWCNEADVFEEVPPERCTRKYHIKRALLRGRNSLQREGPRKLSLGKSLIALPTYAFMLPFLFIIGHHHFMRYMIKMSDHAGKLLAFVGLNPVNSR